MSPKWIPWCTTINTLVDTTGNIITEVDIIVISIINRDIIIIGPLSDAPPKMLLKVDITNAGRKKNCKSTKSILKTEESV